MIKIKNNLFKKVLIYFLIFIIPIIICVGLYFVYNNLFKNDMFPTVKLLIKEKEKINYSDGNNEEEDKKEEKEINNYVNSLPDFRNQYNNQDIMGRLEVQNLNINSLVTRTTNNTYYLSYSLNHEFDKLGVPFFDYRNTDLVNNRQINIYGHNTKNVDFYSKLPFVNLDSYSDINIFNNYKNVYLDIDEKQLKFRVVAVKIITDKNNEHMKLSFRDDQNFLDHVNRLLSNTLYIEDGLDITTNDRLLVMQVCHYDPPDSYLLVICKEVK